MVAWCWLIQVTNINQPCRMVYYITFYIIWLITWVYRGVPWVLRGFTTFKTSNFQQHQCCTKRRAGSGASRRSIGKAMARIGNDWRRYIEAWTKGTIRWVQPTNFLIGGFTPCEKYESQLGILFVTYGKIENVTNHQPVFDVMPSPYSNHSFGYEVPICTIISHCFGVAPPK